MNVAHDAGISALIARQHVLNERRPTAAASEEMQDIARSLTTTPARTLTELALKLRELVDALSNDDEAGWVLDMARSCLSDITILQ